jgi:hypothetical protein
LGKILIVGGGFSSLIASIILDSKGISFDIISLHTNSLEIKSSLIRRKNVEFNKIFSRKSFSLGTIYPNLKLIKLHDRLIHGGNSKIWGGFCDIGKISESAIDLLKKNSIDLKKISFINTGSWSHNPNILKLTYQDRTLDASRFLKNKSIIDGYLLRIKNSNDGTLEVISEIFTNGESEIVNKNYESIILAIGPLQLLDILVRSKFISDTFNISLTEFKHKFVFSFDKFLHFKERNSNSISYSFPGIIMHILGLQKLHRFLKFLNFVPLSLSQCYSFDINSLEFIYSNNALNENINEKSKNIGITAHYCNMKINDIKVNDYLANINPRILGVGMSFIEQRNPGPISNDIISDALSKL